MSNWHRPKKNHLGKIQCEKLFMKFSFLIGPLPISDALIGLSLLSPSSVQIMTPLHFAKAAFRPFHVNRRPIGSNFLCCFPILLASYEFKKGIDGNYCSIFRTLTGKTT